MSCLCLLCNVSCYLTFRWLAGWLMQQVKKRATKMSRGREHERGALQDVISLAAMKNGEFTRNPERARSLAQTLLQRRHWFHLLNLSKMEHGPTAPPPPRQASPCPTRKRQSQREEAACRSPSPNPHESTSSATITSDGSDKSLVLVLDPTGQKAPKKRRCAVSAAKSQ